MILFAITKLFNTRHNYIGLQTPWYIVISIASSSTTNYEGYKK